MGLDFAAKMIGARPSFFFILPPSGSVSFSVQALLHCLLVFSSAIENSNAILVPSPWYVSHFSSLEALAF